MKPVTVRFEAVRGDQVITRHFVVDRQTLAEVLKKENDFCHLVNIRPGEPLNLTDTPSDPISRDKFSTGRVIVAAYSPR